MKEIKRKLRRNKKNKIQSQMVQKKYNNNNNLNVHNQIKIYLCLLMNNMDFVKNNLKRKDRNLEMLIEDNKIE